MEEEHQKVLRKVENLREQLQGNAVLYEEQLTQIEDDRNTARQILKDTHSHVDVLFKFFHGKDPS